MWDAGEMFLGALKGVSDPEAKRKTIGRLFIDVFDQEAAKIEGAAFLAQGTLYPDVIESISAKGGPSQVIKSHHNVGGLPETMKLKLVEPLRELFKDEVRALGRELGLDPAFVGRHPFPGPGLAIRIPGEVTADKVEVLQKADLIWLDEIRKAGLYDIIWQAFAVLLPVKTVGVMGDARTYEDVLRVAGRHLHRWHDGRLLRIPVGGSRPRRNADRQRGPRRQSRRLRRDLKAARHDRVGISRAPDQRPAALTRHTAPPTSSAIRIAPLLSSASPTGRPRALSSGVRKPVTTSCAMPLGLPLTKGMNTTL